MANSFLNDLQLPPAPLEHQPGDGEWRFDWEDIPAADHYEIVILGPSASIPLVHAVTHKSEFNVGSLNSENTDEVQKAGYVADHNLRGWSWRVRAKLSNGIWGAWSREQRFNIRRTVPENLRRLDPTDLLRICP